MKKNYLSYGLILGLILSFLIVLENVVVPNYGPDSGPYMLVTAFVIGTYIVWSAYHGSLTESNKRLSLKIGAITSLIGFCLSMLTFVIVDNVFLETVSKQADKIWGYQYSSYSSMPSFINAGLLRGILVGVPASIVFGLLCGWLATLAPIKRRRPEG